MPEQRAVTLTITEGDILQDRSDVTIFKYAQALHGADKAAYTALRQEGVDVTLPDLHEYQTRFRR
jgi:pyruvate/2-oxoglutarate/acetoin dehydrogenase E1 component